MQWHCSSRRNRGSVRACGKFSMQALCASHIKLYRHISDRLADYRRPVIAEQLQILAPLVLSALWLLLLKRNKHEGVAGATLYLTIVGACSSNFQLAYREVGQTAIVLAAIYVFAVALRTRRLLKINWILLTVLVFIGISAISNYRSELMLSAAVNMVAIVFGVNFLLLRVNSAERLYSFLRYYVEMASVLAGFALIEWFISGERAEATFSNPNYLGYFLGLACVGATLVRNVNGRWWKWALISAGIVVTGSRAAFIFPLLSLIALPFNLRLPPIRTAVCIIGISLPLMATYTLFSPSFQRENLDGSDNERFFAIEAGLAMARERPFTGVGWGRYQEEFWPYFSHSSPWLSGLGGSQTLSQRQAMVSHNDLIRVFAELGVFAGVLFIGLLACSCVLAYRNGGHFRFYLLAAEAGSVGFSLTHNNLNNILFWWVLLLPLAMYWSGVFRASSNSRYPKIARQACIL